MTTYTEAEPTHEAESTNEAEPTHEAEPTLKAEPTEEPYTTAEWEEAWELVDSISRSKYDKDRIKVPIVDVETGIQDFENDLEVLNRLRMDVPAMKRGKHRVVIALVELVRDEVTLAEWLPSVMRRVMREWVDGEATTLLSPKAARESVHLLATEFLAHRLACVRRMEALPWRTRLRMKLTRWSSDTVDTPVCRFSVHSKTPGLRAHWTGSWRISPNYFGITSPATSLLPSGKYIFGVDGGPYAGIQFDTTVVSLPGPTNSITLPY